MNDPSDHDYGLPKEEINSSAVYPTKLSLNLESHQGYPQIITVEASNDNRDVVGVTVKEVLRALHEDLRMPLTKRVLNSLSPEERDRINAAFGERCKSDGDLDKGPLRIDHLGGRDMLQILPNFGPA